MQKDPIFDLDTPLLFAHRGGAGEVPESTKEAFAHAIDVGSDVLELDVQLTSDDQILLWHGPKLDNVLIDGLACSIKERKRRNKRKIFQFQWEELKDKAWVVEPEIKSLEDIEDKESKKIPQRKLMLLSEFMDYVQELDKRLGNNTKIPLNIELKGEKKQFISKSRFFDDRIIENFMSILESKGNGRKILVASTEKRVLDKFTKKCNGAYATNVSFIEQLVYLDKIKSFYFKVFSWFFKIVLRQFKKQSLENRAFQTSHHCLSEKLVENVHKKGGAIHVFLTKLWKLGPLIKENMSDQEIRNKINDLLKMGADGIMTDYPEKVSKLMR